MHFILDCILLHPGKLVRAMIDASPINVKLYENSCLLNWVNNKDYLISYFKNEKINSKNYFCYQWVLKSLGIKKNYNFPITLHKYGASTHK